MKLRHAMVFVKDLEQMADFYGNTLGLRRLPEADLPGWLEFDAGGCRLALHAIPEALARTLSSEEPVTPREDTPIKLVFAVRGLATIREGLIARGVAVSEVKPWGGCDGVDPEGNVFQLLEE